MQIVAKLNNLRISARKVRLVADIIRRKPVGEAQTILGFTVKRGSPVMLKLLRQAIANAKNNFQLEETDLYVSKLTVDDGPKLRRWRARARGSANLIQKKTSHITLVLDSAKPASKKAAKLAGPRQVGASDEGKGVEEKIVQEKIADKKVKKTKFGKDPMSAKPKAEKKTNRFFRRKTF